MAKINDFGEKIGGARKDLWKSRGLQLGDLSEMTEVEISNHVKKDNIWPRPDWVDLVSKGTPQVIAYWQNEMRKAIPPKPANPTPERIRNYVKIVCEIKDAVMAVTDMEQASKFYTDFIKKNYLTQSDRSWYVNVNPEATGVITNKFLSAVQNDIRYMVRPAQVALFGIPEDKKIYTKLKNSLEIHEYDENNVRIKEEDKRLVLAVGNLYSRHYYYLYNGQQFSNKDDWNIGTYFIIDTASAKPLHINIASHEEAEIMVDLLATRMQEKHNKLAKEDKEKNKGKTGSKKRKEAFIPPQLQNIDREGPEYRTGCATGEMYINDLKFKGGEYGNWMSENDRQVSLDMGYDALRDLARTLHIQPEDVSFDGTLSIAFGARGRGGAHAGAAHYELDRQVINLTKMSGAGCLAHEWGHALDHAIGISIGSTKMASELNLRHVPAAFRDVMDAIMWKKVTVDAEESRKNMERRIHRAESQLKSWIDYGKPGNMSDKDKSKWDSLVHELIDNVDSFLGFEYQKYRWSETKTNPYVEALSAMKKEIAGHVIPKDTKEQIAIWASSLKNLRVESKDLKEVERTVHTEYYNGSGEFDKLFAKEKHGYWQSSCEMFARAFDCYISDKLKEAGYKSEYLTAHADSYTVPDGKGGTISAIPLGEERKIINEKFDFLIENLKEIGFFQEYIEPAKEVDIPEIDFDWNIDEQRKKSRRSNTEPEKPVRYKQMSFADLIENAATRSGSTGKGRASSPNRDFRGRE